MRSFFSVLLSFNYAGKDTQLIVMTFAIYFIG